MAFTEVRLLVCGDRLAIAMPHMESESQTGIDFAAKTCPWGTLAFATAMEIIRRMETFLNFRTFLIHVRHQFHEIPLFDGFSAWAQICPR